MISELISFKHQEVKPAEVKPVKSLDAGKAFVDLLKRMGFELKLSGNLYVVSLANGMQVSFSTKVSAGGKLEIDPTFMVLDLGNGKLYKIDFSKSQVTIGFNPTRLGGGQVVAFNGAVKLQIVQGRVELKVGALTLAVAYTPVGSRDSQFAMSDYKPRDYQPRDNRFNYCVGKRPV
jgi:hypothetical protein